MFSAPELKLPLFFLSPLKGEEEVLNKLGLRFQIRELVNGYKSLSVYTPESWNLSFEVGIRLQDEDLKMGDT